MKNHLLIGSPAEAVSALDSILERVGELRNTLDSELREYRAADSPSTSQEIRLLGSLLLAQELVPKLHESWSSTSSFAVGHPSTRPRQKLRLFIDGAWRAHEFSSALTAINATYQLFAVKHVAIDRMRRRPGSSFPRSDIYENAYLFYYLDSADELALSRVRYASPGELELLSQLAAQLPEMVRSTYYVILLVTVIPRVLREVPSLRRHWVEENARVDRIRQQGEMARRHHEMARVLQERFSERAREALQGEERHVRELAEQGPRDYMAAFREVSDTEAVDPLRLTERQIDALGRIARQVESGKLKLVAPTDEDTDGSATMLPNRIAGGFSPPASTTPRMRVRTGRFLRR